MSLILSIETSTPACSVALHLHGKLLANLELHEPQSHAGKLALLIDHCFTLAGKSIDDLNAVAVASGPGSYTGLRIGVSTAKGICYSLSIPLLSCTSLEIMSNLVNNNNPEGAFCCAMLDARRMEVYCSIVDDRNEIVSPVEAKIIDENSFADTLSHKKILFFGDGSDKCRQVIKHSNAVFINGIYPKASVLGEIASCKLEKGLVENLISFEPFYLKEFNIRKSSDVLQ
jgi:tRNA threonylcarbamoyladenosine biosynthesis protein TsaB